VNHDEKRRAAPAGEKDCGCGKSTSQSSHAAADTGKTEASSSLELFVNFHADAPASTIVSDPNNSAFGISPLVQRALSDADLREIDNFGPHVIAWLKRDKANLALYYTDPWAALERSGLPLPQALHRLMEVVGRTNPSVRPAASSPQPRVVHLSAGRKGERAKPSSPFSGDANWPSDKTNGRR